MTRLFANLAVAGAFGASLVLLSPMNAALRVTGISNAAAAADLNPQRRVHRRYAHHRYIRDRYVRRGYIRRGYDVGPRYRYAWRRPYYGYWGYPGGYYGEYRQPSPYYYYGGPPVSPWPLFWPFWW